MSDDNNSGGNTLGGGRAEPLPESWARSSERPRVGRIGDWNNASSSSPARGRIHAGVAHGGGHLGPDEDENDEEEEEEEEGEGEEESDPRHRETWFAGGERSGLAVQNPEYDGSSSRDLVNRLLEKAARGGVYNPPEPRGPQYFTGGGHTLGADDIDSTFVPDPSANEEPEEEEVPRHLYLWRDGFSIEDGPLMRFNPENDRILALIMDGRAPPSIMNVRYNQPVKLVITKRSEEDYQPPKRTGAAAIAFTGVGNRLGAPVPATDTAGHIPGAFPLASSSSSAPQREPQSLTTRFEVDQTAPMTSVQIRLADGTRIVARMNLTHTVSDLRNFINASRPGMTTRSYTIGTAFPNRTLDDGSQTIEAAGLKNSVIVQRWA